MVHPSESVILLWDINELKKTKGKKNEMGQKEKSWIELKLTLTFLGIEVTKSHR